MGMLADWYFCTTMRLSPSDTHALLDTLAVLRRRQLDRQEVLDAAESLGSAPSWLQIYALLPLFTACDRLAEAVSASAAAAGRDEPDDSPVEPGDDGARHGDPELEERLVGLCYQILAGEDHPLVQTLGPALGATVRGADSARRMVVEDVATPLVDAHPPSARIPPDVPYHDLPNQIVPTLAVIALAVLTLRRPTSGARNWFGADAPAVASAALNGEHGRLALLVAVEAAGRADQGARDELWRTLWADGRGAAHLQPDLLAALARLWFGHPDLDDPPSIDALEAEALTGEDQAGFAQSFPHSEEQADTAFDLLGGQVGGSPSAMAAVLWSATLWELAAEADPRETATRLGRWWRAPKRISAVEDPVLHVGSRHGAAAEHHLDELIRMRRQSRARLTIDDRPITDTTPEVGSAICSPWLERWHDGWDHERRNGTAFNTSGTAEPLVWLLASAGTAVSLLTDLHSAEDADGGTDHLVALLFHTCDVLRDHAALLVDLETGGYAGHERLGHPLVAFLWHVNRVVDEVGTGQHEHVPPRLLAGFATRVLEDDTTTDPAVDEQAARLARQGVGAIATLWMRTAWASSSSVPGSGFAARWFEGDPPHALRLLMQILDRLAVLEEEYRRLKNKQANRVKKGGHGGESLIKGLRQPDPMPSAQLLREIYPDDWPDPVRDRWPRLHIDWYAQREGLRRAYQGLLGKAGGDPSAVSTNTVRAERLLLSPRYPASVWDESTPDLMEWTREGKTPLTMRALRLAAVLRDGAVDRHGDWVDDWLDQVYAIPYGRELPGEVRALMLRFFDGEDAPADITDDAARRVGSVHEATIDAVIEFGGHTPRMVELLLAELARQLPLGAEGAERLRLRALETIYRERRHGRAGGAGFTGASALRRRRRTAADLELAILGFLRAITSGRYGGHERVPIAERARELWEQMQVPPPVQGARTPLADRRRGHVGMPDEHTVAATAVDRFEAQEIVYRLDLAAATASGRVHNLFPSADYRRRIFADAGRRRSTIGVVAAAEDGRVWFNVGLAESLPYDLPAGTPAPGVGEVTAVELEQDPVRVLRTRALLRPEPTGGEVRAAVVETPATGPWLTVTVDGTSRNAYPQDDTPAATETRRRWDPDLSRPYAPAEPGRERVPARWDPDLEHWVPVDRRLTELVLDEPDLVTGIRLAHAGGDRFVTRPGYCYRLDGADWQDGDALHDLLRGRSPGTAVQVALAADTPGLAVLDDDDAVVRWLDLFADSDGDLAVATRGADRRYTMQVDAPPGFPATVPVRGAEGAEQRVHVVTSPWSDRQARLAEAHVTPVPMLGVDRPAAPTPDRFEDLFAVAQGDVLTLQNVFSNQLNGSVVLANTRSKLVVMMETDSLSLADAPVGRPPSSLVSGRSAEVTRVHVPTHPDRPGPALTVAELVGRVHTAGAEHAEVLQLLHESPAADGVIVAREATRRGADGAAQTAPYGIWLRCGQIVHYVELEQEWFGSERPYKIGLPVAGRRSADGGWSFHVVPRDIYVRGLYELRESGDAVPDDADYVGADGDHDLHQLALRPVLVRTRTAGGDALQRLGLGSPELFLNDRRPAATRTVAVRGSGSDRRLLGVATFRGDASGARVTGAWLTVHRPVPGNGTLVHARRTFVVSTRQAARVADTRTDHIERWRRFEASGNRYVTGTIVSNDAFVDIGGGLHVPGPDGRLASRIPLRAGEAPNVAGVAYLRSRARLRLEPQGEGYVAAYSTVAPRTPAEFLRLIGYGRADGVTRSVHDDLYYVGPPTEELDAHVFEWGYGGTVAVPADRLTVTGAPDARGLPALFHGDRVDAVSFAPAEDDEERSRNAADVVMAIGRGAIRPQFVTQVVEERQAQYLHLLDVEVGATAGTVRILRAQAARRSTRSDDPFRGATWVPFLATLADEDVKQLLEALRRPGGDAGLVRRRILARFNAEDAIRTGGRKREFRAVRAGEHGLRQGDRVFLTAKGLERTDNELTVVFGLPESLDDEEVQVRVNRREFAFRESTLARVVADGLDFASGEVTMLVRLSHTMKEGFWRGSTVDVPARQPETLRGYLTHRGGAGYAVLGRNRDGLRLEIQPGVLYDASVATAATPVDEGAVVRLTLDGGRLTMFTALPADRTYICAGRPAVVLPKSSLLRRTPAARSDPSTAGGFTVSGLPDVAVTPRREVGTTVLATAHPKVAFVTTQGGPFRMLLPDPRLVQLVRLTGIDPAQPAALKRMPLPGGNGEQAVGPIPVPWARMAFRDASASEIAQMCALSKWAHHDRVTGHVVGGRVVGTDRPLRPATMSSEGVFADDDSGWTLRYRPHRLLAYGFPAGLLMDGLENPAMLTVAGVSDDGGGTWVETSPGRVVEIRGALITTTDQRSLADLDWSTFTVGDRIVLRPSWRSDTGRRRDAGPGHLELSSWRTTLRSGMSRADRASRILLPVHRVERRGALQLGSGPQKITYPVATGSLKAFAVGDAVWLDAANDVEVAEPGSVRPGDVVLVGLTEDGDLHVHGMPGIEVALAGPTTRKWPGYEWLRRALNEPGTRAELFGALEGGLPLTVDGVGIDRPRVTLCREGQSTGEWPSGRTVRTEVLTAWRGRWLLLGSGGAIRSVPVGDAVSGVPPQRAADAAAALAATGPGPTVLWWSVDERGATRPGLGGAGDRPVGRDLIVAVEHEVVVEGVAVGVVCRDLASGRLYWLGAELASWSRGTPNGSLAANLTAAGRLTAQVLPDGSLTVIGRPAVQHRLRQLALGQSLSIVVGEGEPVETPSGHWRYVARLEVPSVLLNYDSPDRRLGPGTSRLVEVDSLEHGPQPSVVVVDIDTRTVTVDLPVTLLAAHQRIGEDRERPASPDTRFGQYRTWYREGLPDPATAPDDPVEGVVRLAGHLTDGETQVEPELTAEIARRWLAAYGDAAFNLAPDQDMDVAPLLASAIVLDACAVIDPRATVLYLRQIGRRATASLHTEQLATAWVARPERHTMGGAWERLRKLTLDRELQPRHVRQLREFCRAMLIKPALRTVESDLAPIARSLLAATGHLPSAAELLGDAPVLGAIALWARAFLTPKGSPAAQPGLLPAQRTSLYAMAEHVINDAVPATLLPVMAPPSSDELPLARRTVGWGRGVGTNRGDER